MVDTYHARCAKVASRIPAELGWTLALKLSGGGPSQSSAVAMGIPTWVEAAIPIPAKPCPLHSL